jgi:hypothetical protein
MGDDSVSRGAGGLWKPGQSPNPGGRAKKRAELTQRIQERGIDLIEALFALVDDNPEFVTGERGGVPVGPSHRDRIDAIKLLLAYGYGKPTLAVELTGRNGGPILNLSTLSTPELKELRGLVDKAKEPT